MNPPDKRIVRFIRHHHVLTLSTASEKRPWVAHCFYAYYEKEQMLVVTSDLSTRHIREALRNNLVSGGIVLETKLIGKIRGIQFEGILEEPQDELYRNAHITYLKRFPFAVLTNTRLWTIRLTGIKMTDNRLGFGKKLYWINQDYRQYVSEDLLEKSSSNKQNN
ncbi:MAG TPA: pyridoxamine 5'-phosphate oxidase family protein [Bacteroidales bacterium]|nr:pyridoxamine 5'-phosphate oxidase family protein [Bacteroidales bacterium]